MDKNTTASRIVVAVAAVALGSAITNAAQGRGGETATSPRVVSYDADQARAGKAVFERACRGCHTVASDVAPVNAGDVIPLVGPRFVAKWRTVGDLFSKTRSTMPANAMGQLSLPDTLNVVAYMLQVNGFRAGRAALPEELSRLHGLVLDPAIHSTAPTANDLRAGAFYTEAQAKRGEAYFLGNCATCHSMEAGARPPRDLAMGLRGALLGPQHRSLPIATGASRWQRYPDVFALFNKIRRSMPAHDPDALSVPTYVDITAYVLKVNGAPAGSEELVFGEHAMKSMMLNEPGFQRLFNGKDFTGIKLVVGANCRVADAGCRQQEAGRPFMVRDGLIIATGAGQGYWYPDATYRDFTLRFDFRYVTPKDLDDSRDFLGNSGYLLFVTDHQVWPRMLQIEGGMTNMLTPAPLGGKAIFTVDAEARRQALRPVNEWNSVEIVAKEGQVTSRLNTVVVSTVTSHDFTEAGNIGFQAEAGELQWRNIRIRPE